MSEGFSPELRAELLDDFYAEADEYLGQIRAQLTALEPHIARSDSPPDAVEKLFRSVHSLKGISAMAGLRPAETLAHAAEDFLRALTRGTARLDPARFELLLAATLQLERMIAAHRLHQPVPEPAEVLRQLTELGAVLSSSPSAPLAPAAPEAPPSPPTTLAKAASIRARGLSPWSCTFRPSRELDQRGVNLAAVRSRLSTLGEIVEATPHVHAGGSIDFEFLLALSSAPDDLAAWSADGLSFQPVEPPPAPNPVAPNENLAADDATNLFVAPSHIVRVDLSRLDELMRITGELVIHRSRLDERISQTSGDTAALKETSIALARSLRQLRSAITRVRLVPIAEIFSRMPFVVRDLARESQRQVRLAIEGEHTEIDKYLVERLKEPLLHLVRNAFSHGVEPPAERLAAGKPAEATILLRASAAGEWVQLEIRDDGRGVESPRVAERARALGLRVPDPLDDAGLLALLCTPGFSTRDEADRAAGRGIGMAVVHNTVRELGGTVTLESSTGHGTCFRLRLPLTLSIAEAIIVSAGEQTCAVPQGFIQEIIPASEADVRVIKLTEVIPYRDGVLPVVRLRSLFGAPAAPRPEISVLVLRSDRGSTGLLVDRVHAQREIVVRPMRDPLLQVPGVAGATELGDGRPVLILDPLAFTAGVVRPSSRLSAN